MDLVNLDRFCQHSSVTDTGEKCNMAAVSVKWGRRSYTSITGRDICTFSVLFSVSHLTFLYTCLQRHFMLRY